MSQQEISNSDARAFIEEKAAKLARRLSDPVFLEHTGFAAARLREFAGREWWEKALPAILPIRERIRCADVLALCRVPMSHIAHEPVGGWLSFAYQYASCLLYPDEEFLEGNTHAIPATRFFLEVLQFLLDEERAALPAEAFMDFVFLTPTEYERNIDGF